MYQRQRMIPKSTSSTSPGFIPFAPTIALLFMDMCTCPSCVSQTDLPPFVKIQNVPEEETVTAETFTRSTEWFNSKVCRRVCYRGLASD